MLAIHIDGPRSWFYMLTPAYPWQRFGLLRDENNRVDGFYFLGLQISW